MTLFEGLGSGGGLLGALAVVRGVWSDVTACVVVVVIASFLAGLWETAVLDTARTGPDTTRKEEVRGNDSDR